MFYFYFKEFDFVLIVNILKQKTAFILEKLRWFFFLLCSTTFLSIPHILNLLAPSLLPHLWYIVQASGYKSINREFNSFWCLDFCSSSDRHQMNGQNILQNIFVPMHFKTFYKLLQNVTGTSIKLNEVHMEKVDFGSQPLKFIKVR